MIYRILAALFLAPMAFGQGQNFPTGQQTSANSIPTVLASDQPAIPVTATNPSVGPTGAAVPADATYAGMNVAGNLVGLTGTANGLKVDVQAIVAQSVTQGTSPWVDNITQFGGANVVTGTGTGGAGIPRVTVSNDSTVGLVAGAAIVGKVGIDQTTPGTTNGVQVNAALPAGGNTIGAVTQASGPWTQNVTQFGSSNVVTGTGASGAGIPRVTTSNDSTVGLVAGAAIIGKVGIDQTTPGTTNAVSETNFPSTVDTNTGVTGASTPRVVTASHAITSNSLASNNYASINVTTSAYVQLISSTATALNVICLSNSSSSIIKLATGAAASEVDRVYIPGGGAACYSVNIASGTRISLEALDATASTGWFLFTGML